MQPSISRWLLNTQADWQAGTIPAQLDTTTVPGTVRIASGQTGVYSFQTSTIDLGVLRGAPVNATLTATTPVGTAVWINRWRQQVNGTWGAWQAWAGQIPLGLRRYVQVEINLATTSSSQTPSVSALAVTVDDLDFIRQAPHRPWALRVELRGRDGTLRMVIETTSADNGLSGGPVISSGSISVDTERDVLRTCDLTIYDPTGQWFPAAGAQVWLDARLHIWKGYIGTAMYPMGVYNLAQPENIGENQVLLHGADKATDANEHPGGGFLNVQVYPKDTLVNTVIRQIATSDAWGESLLNLAPSNVALPFDRYFGHPQYTPWSALANLVHIPEADGTVSRRFFDEVGYLTTAPDPDPKTQPVVENFGPSTAGIGLYLSGRKRIEDGALKNVVVVEGGSLRTGAFRSVVSDTTSSVATSKIGTRLYRHNGGNLDPLLTSQADCDALAAYLLRQQKQWNERVPVTCIEHLLLQPWDVISLVDPAIGVNDRYQVLGFTLPLIGQQPAMTLDGWRVAS
jgi:hypothetical protein